MLQVGDMVRFRHTGPDGEPIIGVIVKVGPRNMITVLWLEEENKSKHPAESLTKVS